MAGIDLNQRPADSDSESDEFPYHRGLSTTTVFVQNPTTGFKCAIGWREQSHNFSFVTPPTTTILSSSNGLLLCRHTHSPSTYYVGNPFQRTPYRTLTPPPLHHSVATHAVLSTVQDTGIFLLICLLPIPIPLPKSNARRQRGMRNHDYAIQAYFSRRTFWLPLSDRIHLANGVNRVVVPNSGVSCGRFAYWLTWLASSRSSVMVVRVDVLSAIDPVKYPLLTYLKVPDCLPRRRQGVRMKLGKVGNKVGLAVVNEESAKVELYLIDEKRTEDYAVIMEDWMHYPGCLKVEVDPTVEEGVVEVVGPNRIKCREMPEPMRFESGKVEVVVAVRGGRRMVLWEGRSSSLWGTRVVAIGDGVNRRDADQAAAAAYLVDRGIPHVTTSLLPNIVAPEE